MTLLINVYATCRELPDLEFPHEFNNARDRSDPELENHLEGFAGYVFQKGGGKMTQHLFHILQHIHRVQNHLSLMVEEDDLDEFADWCEAVNGIVFLPDGTVRDPFLRVLLEPGVAEPEEDATLPYPQDALARKARTEQQLAAQGLSVPATLPPVISEREVDLREPGEVARRMWGLALISVRGESVAGDDPLSEELLRSKLPHAELTPYEEEFLQNENADQRTVAQFVWRYEALYLLQWALGLVEKLEPPTAICQVAECVQRAVESGASEDFVESPALRSADEILGGLDRHYRWHWLCRQASIRGEQPPAGLEPGVIQERHYALNWLVRHEYREWDDVQTPT